MKVGFFGRITVEKYSKLIILYRTGNTFKKQLCPLDGDKSPIVFQNASKNNESY